MAQTDIAWACRLLRRNRADSCRRGPVSGGRINESTESGVDQGVTEGGSFPLGGDYSFVEEVGRRSGDMGLDGFSRLYSFVEGDARLDWELGSQPKEVAYLCSLTADPETVLLRANNFGSVSFWLWRNAHTAERQARKFGRNTCAGFAVFPWTRRT